MLRCHQCFCAFTEVEDLQKHLNVHGWISEQAGYASAALKCRTDVTAGMGELNIKNQQSSVPRKTIKKVSNIDFSRDKKNSESLLLNEVHHSHLMGLSDHLDYTTTGNDYKKLATMFSLPKDDVEQLSLSHLRGERPTEQMIRLLNYRWPEMTMKTFEKKCEEMKRLDVVTYIRNNVY